MSQRKLNLVLLAASLLAISCVPEAQATIKCYQCDSSDSKCLTDLSAMKTADCDTCATFYENNVLKRDCAPTTCNDNGSCRKCSAETCNNHNVCRSCDSSSDASCAQSPAKVVASDICLDKDSKCLILIDSKKTLRRCATKEGTDASCATTSTATCQGCTGANCNVQLFPDNRLTCYQCGLDDTKCANLNNNPDITALPCRLYVEGDKCYTFGTDATHMARGCVSDVGDANKCATPESTQACRTCDASNCNMQSYTTAQALLCYQCQGKMSDTSDKCIWGQTGAPMNCANKIQYNAQEECYTQKKDDVVHRGCVVDRDAALGDCTDANGCTKCTNANGCNKADMMSSTCIRCRSDVEKDCWDEPTKTKERTCTNAVTQATAGCYQGVWNGIAIRGCLVDADERMKYECGSKDFAHCTSCTDKANCNDLKTSGAGALVAAPLMLLLLAAAAILRP